MAKEQGLIQPFEAQPSVNGVGRKYGLTNSWRIQRRQEIPVDGEARLQSADCLRPCKDRKIDGLVVVLIKDVLHRLERGRTRGTAVANLGDVVQTKSS